MIDARGLSCPTPVLLTQDEMKNSNSDVIEVMVDNQCSVENISRLASAKGYEISYEEKDEDFLITLKKQK